MSLSSLKSGRKKMINPDITGRIHPIRNQTQKRLPMLRANSADINGKLKIAVSPNVKSNRNPIDYIFDL